MYVACVVGGEYEHDLIDAHIHICVLVNFIIK